MKPDLLLQNPERVVSAGREVGSWLQPEAVA